MQKYTGKYWIVLAPIVKKSLKKHYGKAFAIRTMEKARTEYREMLNRVDDIGADNPMASNIYMSFIFFAVYRAAKGRITVSSLRTIAHEAIEWNAFARLCHEKEHASSFGRASVGFGKADRVGA
ncbi:hypothetical protein [Ruminococcus sp.]|uniref:hypothetical protein n=1 Tax=Ruminococcus sp. TaxID=41978 RepID=UPI0025CED8B5|nr:hypothetical protein [Ruminococcus sp.]